MAPGEALVASVDQNAKEHNGKYDGDRDQIIAHQLPIPAKPMKASDKMPASIKVIAVP